MYREDMSENFNVVDNLLLKGFVTQTRLAAAARVGQPMIVHWRKENRITHDRMREILKFARAEGIDVGPDDFFEPELRRQGV